MKKSSRISALGLALVGLSAALLLVNGPKAAEAYVDRIDVVPIKLYLKDGRGRTVVTVTNKSSDTLDIDIDCIFSKGSQKVGAGSASLSRLPPRGSEVIEVTDRQTQPLDSVHCDVAHAQK